MTNYKPYSTIALGTEGFHYPLKSGETLKVLTSGVIPATTSTSFHDEAGAAWTVPTGKTFKLISGLFVAGSTGRTLTIMQSDDNDAETNVVKMFTIFYPPGWSGLVQIPLPDTIKCAAAKSVNIDTDNVTTSPYCIYIIGVLSNA